LFLRADLLRNLAPREKQNDGLLLDGVT